MRTRLTVAIGLMIGLLTISLQGADNPKEAVEKPLNAFVLADRLQQIVTIQNEIPETPLIEVLEFLSEKHNLPIQVDPDFMGAGGAVGLKIDRNNVALHHVENPLMNERVTVRKMKSVRLETVLNLVCKQIHGGYLIYADHILLVSFDKLISHVGQNDEGQMVPVHFPLVTIKVEGKPLSQALSDLSDRSNTAILVAPQVAESTKILISAKLLNVPIDRAIDLLAQMGELGVVKKGNAYLVTSISKAKANEPQAPVGALGGLAPNDAGVMHGIEFLRWLTSNHSNDDTTKKLEETTKKIEDITKKLDEFDKKLLEKK